MDLSNWMQNLDEKLQKSPIIFLAIPGSHDSLSYTIKPDSPLSPDAEPVVKILTSCFGKLMTHMIYKWCVTQSDSVTDQLNYGIRYFDLRISIKAEDQNFYFVHGLYGESINPALEEMRNFLENHPGEVIILDFQHFYGLSQVDHDRLLTLLEETFGRMLCPLPDDINSVTVAWMKSNGYRVIVIYRNGIGEERHTMWPGKRWPTPWPETMSKRFLMEFLSVRLHRRPLQSGFVSQCILTPNKTTVLFFWSGDVLSTISRSRLN